MNEWLLGFIGVGVAVLAVIQGFRLWQSENRIEVRLSGLQNKLEQEHKRTVNDLQAELYQSANMVMLLTAPTCVVCGGIIKSFQAIYRDKDGVAVAHLEICAPKIKGKKK